MKKNVLAALMVAAMLIGLVGHAQDTAKIGTSNSVTVAGAHLGVGVGYRNFHTVRLKGASQNSFVGIWTSNSGGMAAYNSDSVHNIVSGNATNVGTYMPASANITVSDGYNLGGHGSWGVMESMAPVVSLDADIYQNDSWTLSVISNLQYYNMDTASSAKGGSIGETTYHTKVYWTDSSNWGQIVRADKDPDYSVTSTSYLTGTGRTKFDLQMLEIDLGLKLGYTLASGLDFYLAAGPSLSYADMESSSGGRHDNDLDYIFGKRAARYADIRRSRYWQRFR